MLERQYSKMVKELSIMKGNLNGFLLQELVGNFYQKKQSKKLENVIACGIITVRLLNMNIMQVQNQDGETKFL
jgi:hypothetical protein